MALQNLDQQVLDQIAESISGDIGITQTMLDDWYTLGARDTINNVIRFNPSKAWVFATDSTISDGNGVSLGTVKTSHIIGVVRVNDSKDYECQEIPFSLAGRAQDVNDLIYATKIDPKFYRKMELFCITYSNFK